MWAGEVIAAWLLNVLELHQLDSRKVWVEDVKMSFAVFSDLGPLVIVRLPAMGFHEGLRLLHIGNAE
jgi:hypothetical protein